MKINPKCCLTSPQGSVLHQGKEKALAAQEQGQRYNKERDPQPLQLLFPCGPHKIPAADTEHQLFIIWLFHLTCDPVKFGWAKVSVSVYIHEGSSHLFWQYGAISQDTGMREGLMCCLIPTFRIQIIHWMCRCLFYGQAAFMMHTEAEEQHQHLYLPLLKILISKPEFCQR